MLCEKRKSGKNHLISFVLMIAMLLTSVGIGFGAETASQAKIVLSNTETEAGKTVTVTAAIEGNPGITTLDFRLSYDSENMELVSCANGGLLQGFTKSQKLTDHPYYCGWINSLQKTDTVKDGTLVTLTFRMKDNAKAGTYAIQVNSGTVTAYNTNLDAVEFTAAGGLVTVKGEETEQKPEDGSSGGSSVPSNPGSPAGPAVPAIPGGSGGTSAGSSSSDTSGGTSAGDDAAADTEQDNQAEAEKAAAEKQAKLIKKFKAMGVNLTSAKYSTAKKRVTLKFKKTNSGIKCPQYQIWRSTKKNSGYKKIYTTTKTTFTNKSLGKNVKAYYYKVRGVRKFDGKNYYTQWSKKVKVTIKK